jgi:hypothetical protein
MAAPALPKRLMINWDDGPRMTCAQNQVYPPSERQTAA